MVTIARQPSGRPALGVLSALAVHLILSACSAGPADRGSAASPSPNSDGASQGVAQAAPNPAVTPAAGQAAAPTSAAGEKNSTGVEHLTVIGRSSQDTPYETATSFFRAHAAPERSGQVGRWIDEICPKAIGLSPTLDDFVGSRIAALAALAKAPAVQQGGCKPNVEIMFTDDPQAIMDRVAELHRGALLGYHYVAQTKQLKTVIRPIQAWYLTATRSSALPGPAATLIHNSGSPGGTLDSGGGHGGALDIEGAAAPAGCIGRFSHCISSVFSNILILVDTRAVAGRKIGPIADYVALLALSHAKTLDACGDRPSLLDSLSPDCRTRPAPDTWTASDIGYLSGLYAINIEDDLWMAKGAIADHIVDTPPSATEAGPK